MSAIYDFSGTNFVGVGVSACKDTAIGAFSKNFFGRKIIFNFFITLQRLVVVIQKNYL
jgi:hypothetical protein